MDRLADQGDGLVKAGAAVPARGRHRAKATIDDVMIGDELESDGPSGSLGQTVVRGLRWTLFGTAASRILTLGSSILMARLLSPQDFGIYTAGALVLMIAAYINDLGLEPILVRWPGGLDRVAPTAITMVAAMSTALFGVVWVLAPWLAATLGSPGSAGVVRVLAVALLISGVFTCNSAQVNRAFRQRARASAELCSTVVNVGVGLSLAFAGFGAYSLAIAQICGNVVVSVGLYLASPTHYTPGFSRPVAVELTKAGIPLAVSGLFAAAALNIDFIVVGNRLGATALGLYVLAWNISSWPFNTFIAAIQHMSVAAFAKLQDDQTRLANAFRSALNGALMTTGPVCAILAGLAVPLVHTLYGTQWAAAATPLALLALAGATRVVSTLASDLLIAIGWTGATFYLRGLWLIAMVIALPIGAALGGIDGVAVGQVAVGILVVIPSLLIAMRKRGFLASGLFGAMRLPVGASLLALVVSFGCTLLPVSALLQLLIGATLGLSSFGLVTFSYWWPKLEKSIDARRH